MNSSTIKNIKEKPTRIALLIEPLNICNTEERKNSANHKPLKHKKINTTHQYTITREKRKKNEEENQQQTSSKSLNETSAASFKVTEDLFNSFGYRVLGILHIVFFSHSNLLKIHILSTKRHICLS